MVRLQGATPCAYYVRGYVVQQDIDEFGSVEADVGKDVGEGRGDLEEEQWEMGV